MKSFLLCAVPLCVLFLFACAPAATPTPTCDAADYLKQSGKLVSQFKDLSDHAGATARIALSPVVGQMQDLRRAFSKLNVPSCAQEYHDTVTKAMNEEIQAYLDVMAQKPDSAVQADFQLADLAFQQATLQLKLIQLDMGTPRP